MPNPASALASELEFRHWPAPLRRVLFAIWCAFWVLMILISVQDNWGDAQWWEPLLWEGSSALFASLLIKLTLNAGRDDGALLATPRRWFWHRTRWLPVIATLFVICIYSLRHGFEGR